MNEITTSTPALPVNPFARGGSEHLNAGTVEIESSRAIAEAQGKLVIAKRFPRDEARAYAKIIESCKRKGLADEATYAFDRGGQTVSGPSIRLAEELARAWGNIDYGIRELSRKDGVSEMEAYAWDLETNTSSSQKFSVRHWRDTKNGGYAIKDERDIYELTANHGARRLRARVLAILPPDLVEAALAECKLTMAGKSDEPIADRVRKMIRAFEKFGVTAPMIELRLGHTLDAVLPDELSDLVGIFNSLKSGMSKAGDWFGGAKPAPEASNILEGDTTPAPAAEVEVLPPAPKKAKAVKADPHPDPYVEQARKAAENTQQRDAARKAEPVTPPATDDGDIFG